MRIAVYDTYVKRRDGQVMHFDVIVPADCSPQQALIYGQQYLADKPVIDQTLTSQQCRFCHTQPASPQWAQAISDNGYFIYEMEGCD